MTQPGIEPTTKGKKEVLANLFMRAQWEWRVMPDGALAGGRRCRHGGSGRARRRTAWRNKENPRSLIRPTRNSFRSACSLRVAGRA